MIATTVVTLLNFSISGVRTIPQLSAVRLVSYAAVLRVVTQRFGGALRDNPKDGCEGDYCSFNLRQNGLSSTTTLCTLAPRLKKGLLSECYSVLCSFDIIFV